MRKLILIIDDEIFFAQPLITYLDVFYDGKFQIHCAENVSEAIEFLTKNQYHLILCDLLLPLGNLEFTNEIEISEEENHFNGIKIIEFCIKKGIDKDTKIILSSAANKVAKGIVEKYGSSIEYLRKPYEIKELLERIENAH